MHVCYDVVVVVFVLLFVALYWDIFDGSGPASRAVEAARSDGRIENNGNNQNFNICKNDDALGEIFGRKPLLVGKRRFS